MHKPLQSDMNCAPSPRSSSPSFPSLYNPLTEQYKTCEQHNSHVTHLDNPGDLFRFTLYWTLIFFIPVFLAPGVWGFVVHFIPRRITYKKQRNLVTDGGYRIGESMRRALSPPSSRPFLLYGSHPNIATHLEGEQTINLSSISSRGRFRRSGLPKIPSIWPPSRTLRDLQSTTQAHSVAEVSTPLSSRGLTHPLSRLPDPKLSSLRDRSTGITCLILAIPLIFIAIATVIGVLCSFVIAYLLAALRDTTGVWISTWIPLGWAVIIVHSVLLG